MSCCFSHIVEMQIFRVLHAVPYSNREPVQDVIANLHAYVTCNLLIGLAILLSYKQFGGRPIECMLPQTGSAFNGAWEQYAEQFCWSTDTYFVPFNESIESYSPQQLREKRVSYYQWVSFFLLFQAACFKAPTLIWRYFAGESGMRVGQVLRLATNDANSEPTTRASNIRALCQHLQGALRFHLRLKAKRLKPHKWLRLLNLRYASYYVTLIYMICKLTFLANSLIQTELLNRYLVPNAAQGFGLSAWQDLWHGNRSWHESGLFPRVTLCDFSVREMGQTQNFTVQCVLILNVFTEKAFIFLWGYYNLLTLITILNVTIWAFALINPRSAEHFIYNHLEMHGSGVFANESTQGLEEIQVQVGRFIDKYLRVDGIFILRQIAQHADVVFTTDLIAELWCGHYRIEKRREALKLSDQRWQEHMRRFAALEERALTNKFKDGLSNVAFAHLPFGLDEAPPKLRYQRETATLSPTTLMRHNSESRIFDNPSPRTLTDSSGEEDERELKKRRNSSIKLRLPRDRSGSRETIVVKKK